MTGPQQLPLAAIRMDGGTQSRAALSEDAISDYAAAYAAGVAMPPVVVFLDAHGLYWLADGFHRCYGAQRRGAKTIAAEVHHGTQRDAILYSVGANAQHGLRRTNADKRRAVEMLLRDPEWSAKSDRWIATATGVHHETVASYRVAAPAHVAESATSDGASRRAGQDGKSYPARGRETITPDASAAVTGGHLRGYDSAPAGGEKPATFEREPGEDDDATDAEPAIDMRGLPASRDWVANVGAVVAEMELMDQDLRAARKSIATLAKLGMHGTHVEALKVALANALHEVEQRTPVAACRFCGDPDGSKGKRATCGACLGAGYTVRSQEPGAVVPAKVKARAVVEPQSTGRPAPRNRIVLEREDGTEAAYDPTEAA